MVDSFDDSRSEGAALAASIEVDKDKRVRLELSNPCANYGPLSLIIKAWSLPSFSS